MNDNLSTEKTYKGRVWTLLGGAALILAGVLLLFQNFGAIRLGNWWAVFFIVPFLGGLIMAWTLYQGNGKRFTRRVMGTALGGVMSLLVGVLLFFDLDWGKLWPLFLIVAGVSGMLYNLGERE